MRDLGGLLEVIQVIAILVYQEIISAVAIHVAPANRISSKVEDTALDVPIIQAKTIAMHSIQPTLPAFREGKRASNNIILLVPISIRTNVTTRLSHKRKQIYSKNSVAISKTASLARSNAPIMMIS